MKRRENLAGDKTKKLCMSGGETREGQSVCGERERKEEGRLALKNSAIYGKLNLNYFPVISSKKQPLSPEIERSNI